MMDKDSYWGYDNGLQTVIPTALLFSTIGYPFILPDMIGGNVYYDEELPSEELFIRWMQLNAFMPAMQFSISPWQYDDEKVKTISKKYMAIGQILSRILKIIYSTSYSTKL